MTILTPGINKEITRVSLKDEPHDPAETKSIFLMEQKLEWIMLSQNKKLLTR